MTNLYMMVFMLMTMMGTIISISSHSWMGMWLGLEINLLSIIPLFNNQKNIFSSESSMKYFITQAMASTILLFAMILLMSEFYEINNLSMNKLKMMILNSALLTKMGAAPFHFWFPEVMEGLSWMNCLIMLTWQKIAPMILLMYNMKMIYFLSIIIVFSMLISGIMGISQVSMRKILAYSSINHIAWMISSMLFIETVWSIYFIVYSIITINIVLILKLFKIFYIKQLVTSMNMNFSMKFFFIMNFLSLGGLPPFLGFFPKWLAIQVMIENKFYFMTFLMVLTTLITLYFYMRVTFSVLVIKTSEISWLKSLNFKTFKNKQIMSLNFVSLTGLILCTIFMNWM